MKKIYASLAALLLTIGIAGCDVTINPTPDPKPPATATDSKNGQSEKEVNVVIYRSTADSLSLTPVSTKIKTKDPLPKAALSATIADNQQQKYPVFPKGLSVNSVEVKDGTATVDFSKELANIEKGTTTEELFTAMTVDTLTEFPEIKEVRFLMEGKQISHLSGHSDMTRTFKRNESIIKK